MLDMQKHAAYSIKTTACALSVRQLPDTRKRFYEVDVKGEPIRLELQ